MGRSILFIAVLLGATLQAPVMAAVAADGQALYKKSCVSCHGPTGKGALPGVPDLSKGGAMAKPDAVLVGSILNGFKSKGSRMAMPAKGGNPKLTAADAQALVAYMRTLQVTPSAK